MLDNHEKSFFKLILRSNDKGNGWRNISQPVLEWFRKDIRHKELFEVEEDKGRIRLSAQGMTIHASFILERIFAILSLYHEQNGENNKVNDLQREFIYNLHDSIILLGGGEQLANLINIITRPHEIKKEDIDVLKSINYRLLNNTKSKLANIHQYKVMLSDSEEDS